MALFSEVPNGQHNILASNGSDKLRWRYANGTFAKEVLAHACGNPLARNQKEIDSGRPHHTYQDLWTHLGTPNEDAVREALTVRPSASSPPESEMKSSHVSLLKFDLPQWNADDPAFWFKQAEDAFAMVKKPNGETQEVTDKEKLTIVGRHLPPKTMAEYKHLYIANDYDKFEKAICGAAIKTDTVLLKK